MACHRRPCFVTPAISELMQVSLHSLPPKCPSRFFFGEGTVDEVLFFASDAVVLEALGFGDFATEFVAVASFAGTASVTGSVVPAPSSIGTEGARGERMLFGKDARS
jgi:hypothetical protein